MVGFFVVRGETSNVKPFTFHVSLFTRSFSVASLSDLKTEARFQDRRRCNSWKTFASGEARRPVTYDIFQLLTWLVMKKHDQTWTGKPFHLIFASRFRMLRIFPSNASLPPW